MILLGKVGIFCCAALLIGFALVVVAQIGSGRIRLDGLLRTKEPDGESTFSPARLQLLIFTIVVAARYLFAVIAHPGRESLPDLAPGIVAALGASHAVYLGGKAVSFYLRPLLKRLG
jgi:hypothetical protein